MPLNIGDRLGHYDVTAKIGEGGCELGDLRPGHRRGKVSMGRSVVAQLGACILLLGLGVSEAEAQAAGVTEPEPVSRFETVDGFRFHYLDWGNESAQPLLLLHGNGQHAHFWDTFAEAVAQFFRVVALDQPGYGDSDPPRDATYDRAVFVEQLDSFVRQLGLHEFILMGHSMGGMSAFPYAALHPENVARLILVDVGPFDTTNTPPARNETTRPKWRNVCASREEAFEFYKAYALDGVPSRRGRGEIPRHLLPQPEANGGSSIYVPGSSDSGKRSHRRPLTPLLSST